jgi:hypothetical protein
LYNSYSLIGDWVGCLSDGIQEYKHHEKKKAEEAQGGGGGGGVFGL